jgi:hypothetical protein
MAMYTFVLLFREAKFCGMPSCVFDKWCAAGEKWLRNTDLMSLRVVSFKVPKCSSSYHYSVPSFK